jgi:methionyl-tRNA formyltransferase
MNYIFAGDRDISVWVLKELIGAGCLPKALLVPEPHRASHYRELIELVDLPENKIIVGQQFANKENLKWMESLNLDYIICIHFPYILSKSMLEIPKHGVLNLHPALLPYNRGWHTPSWAILENNPIGATLHFMTEEVDMGDIVHQREVEVSPSDTADSLYKKIKSLELEVFREALPNLFNFSYNKSRQAEAEGSTHQKKDLFSSGVQRIDLTANYKGSDLICKLRALTTNNIEEAAYFELGGKRYRIQISIKPEVPEYER